MRDNHAEFRHVRRGVFDRVSDRIENDEILSKPLIIYYNGTNLYGDLTIEASAGHIEEYKKALKIFLEEYCK